MAEEPHADLEAATERLYAIAGRCINGWAYVDQALFDIFRAVLTTDLVKASVVYYRFTSFNDHLTITDKIVSATLIKGTPEIKEWALLKKRIDALLPIRNKIAHHPVTVFSKQVMTPLEGAVGWAHRHQHWLAYVEEGRKLAHLDQQERFGRIKSSQVTESDLLKHHAETADLHTDLQSFLGRAAGVLGKPAPEPTWPETQPATGPSH